MLNAPLLLETALLMLAAFLVGAVLGTAARWLATRQKPVAATASPAAAPAAAATGPQLVVAPEIAPVGARPTVAARIAAAAEGRSAALPETGMSTTIAMPKSELPAMPVLSPIQPSHVAGETVTGRHIENPVQPDPASATAPESGTADAAEASTPSPIATIEAAASPLTPVLAATAADHVVTPDEAPDIAEASAEEEGDSAVLHIEPTVAPDNLQVVDGPAETAEKIQETHPTAIGTPAPEVAAETPLVEPEVERQAAEDDESLLDRAEAELPEPAAEAEAVLQPAEPVELSTSPTQPEPATAVPAAPQPDASPSEPQPEVSDVPEGSDVPEMTEAEAELAAMHAIEKGWTPRASTAPRPAADLPEGVSPEESAAAEKAVANAGVAVASAAARAAAILQEIDTAPVPANDPGPAPAAAETDSGESPAEARSGRSPGGFGRPAALEAPRDGTRDDLGQIKGISPTIASALNGLGIYHYDQIADWDQKAVVWVENHFGFKGRIARERWQDQARDLGRGRPPVARPVRR